jgi:hypothetical protein
VLKMTGGDGNGCGVPNLVLRPGWCKAGHREMASAGGATFFNAA